MKILVVFLFAVPVFMVIARCGTIPNTEEPPSGYSIVCVERVRYIQFSSGGATVQVGPDGRVQTCE